ncbi:MAG: hypothetical protein ABIV94_09505 [Acidimicrobiales bacterium]
MTSDEPTTVWEEKDGVRSGGAAIVRAAAFSIGGSRRGAVSLTLRVPDGSWEAITGGGATATLLLNPNEARGFAAWLDAAATAADGAGPPLYGDA